MIDAEDSQQELAGLNPTTTFPSLMRTKRTKGEEDANEKEAAPTPVDMFEMPAVPSQPKF